MNGMPAETKRALLIAAAVIFAAAMIWLLILESHSYTRAVCNRLNEFGYRVSPSDLYSQGYGSNASISELIEEDISLAKELSQKAGFGADTETKGRVELLLYSVSDKEVMYIWLLDRQPQLVFIEDMENGSIRSITE